MTADSFALSNALGDGMVLQHDRAVIWGFGTPGHVVSAQLIGGESLSLPPVAIGSDGVWRVALPPQPASLAPHTLHFGDAVGDSRLVLRDVLFGDVLLCSGQSNMQHGLVIPYTLANASIELAEAHLYAERVRLFSVGMDATCIGPHTGRTPCAQPLRELNNRAPPADSPACTDLKTGWRRPSFGAPCRLAWSRATARVLRHSLFSAVCYLTAKRLAAADPSRPYGLISAAWAATPMQVWQPLRSLQDCNARARVGGVLFHSMVAPLALAPLGLRAVLWYQVRAKHLPDRPTLPIILPLCSRTRGGRTRSTGCNILLTLNFLTPILLI